LARIGAFSLVRAFVAISKHNPSPDHIESIAAAVAAMSSFPDLHCGLVLESDALSFLAPLCVEDVGIQRQEASIGIGSLCAHIDCNVTELSATGTLALLCSCSGSIDCTITAALQVTWAPLVRTHWHCLLNC
jgi:hypothetical protein